MGLGIVARRDLVRVGIPLWVGMWAAVIVVAVAVATEGPSDSGEPDAAGPVATAAAMSRAEGVMGASMAGVAVSVADATFSETESKIVVEVVGREDAGANVRLLSRVALVPSEGRAVHAREVSVEGRRLTLLFPAVSDRGDYELQLLGLAIGDDQGPPPVSASVPIGEFHIRIPEGSVERTTAARLVVNATSAFGRGEMQLSEVILEPTAVTIRATLTGFKPEQVPFLAIWPPSLTLPGSVALTPVRAVITLDGDLTSVELRFEGVAPASVDGIRLQVPYGVAEREGLADASSIVAELRLGNANGNFELYD